MASAPPQGLSPPKAAIVHGADRKLVEAALARLSVTGSGDWLIPGNPYAIDAGKRLHSDSNAVPPLQSNDFLDYMAASAFVHCGDGWSYLGRSVDALLRGDIHAAVHLIYYAELRAAISLLASEGIYIGNGVNLVASQAGTLEDVTRDRTHDAAWKYLATWKQGVRCSSLLGQILRPGNTSLDEWSQNIPNTSIIPMVSDLLDKMAFDLQAFVVDRTRRNTASYNPSRIRVDDIDLHDRYKTVSQLWLALEPDTRGGFPNIDQSLLWKILTGAFSSVTKLLDEHGNLTDDTDWSAWESWLSSAVPNQSVGSPIYEEMLQAPTSLSSNALLDEVFANDVLFTSPVAYIRPMIGRTMVLLRMATGSCILLLQESGIGDKEIEPWVNSLGVSRGLWTTMQRPDNPLDLWQDAELARVEIESALANKSHHDFSVPGAAVFVLGQTERIIAWSFLQ